MESMDTPLVEASEEWHKIEQAYTEIQRRDDSAELRAWRWERFALGLLAVWLLTLGIVVWQLVSARNIQAFVQVVQQDEQGNLVQVGIPHDVLYYTPPEGLWMDMLGTWVRSVRWRGTDTTQAKAQWAWAYRHTCSQARRMVQALEEKEQPFKSSKRLTSVELKSITRTPAPESYQVLWAETSLETDNPTIKKALWTGTFSVGRLKPPTLADAMDNRLGLCVTAFDISPQP
jgi:type IV secretory pathway TrbF-like protein